MHERLEHLVVVAICRTGLERHVQRKPRALAPPNIVGRAGARIERILMRRDVQHTRVLVENPLRAVAMMHVVIHDDDPLHAERQRMRGRGRHAVVEAESHRPIALGVMARRPNQRHHARRARLNDGLDSANGGAGGQQRDVARVRRRVGVGIERHGPARRRVDGRQDGCRCALAATRRASPAAAVGRCGHAASMRRRRRASPRPARHARDGRAAAGGRRIDRSE